MANTQHIPVGNGEGSHFSALQDVLRELSSLEIRNGRYLIQMPVATAYGCLVSVSVWPEGNGETFLISDDGGAYEAAATACASERTFATVAATKCRHYGAQFDGHSMLFIRVDASKLKGAIVAMASLVKEVVDETISRAFSTKVDTARERFVKRVAEAFPNFDRTESATIIGNSTAEYEFDVVVKAEHKVLAFDYFSKSGNSINSAYAKLSDVARIGGSVKPVGVTPNLDGIGPKLTLLTSVAQIIEANAATSAYQQLAA